MTKVAQSKVIVYIDGENLLHRVEEVLVAAKLIKSKTDITAFGISWPLRQVVPEYSDIEIRYYGTKLKLRGITDAQLRAKAERMVEAQRRLKRSFSRQGVEFVASGNLRLRDGVACRKCGHQEAIFQEKGVDVRLATDLLWESKKGETRVLVSSDSDLLPAVRASREVGTTVVYLSFTKSVNRALAAATDKLKTYSADQVIEAFAQAKGVN